jgi:predicted DNA-binding transcriptional regulator YafY
MARKAIVDREIVLQLLKEGQTSKAIAERFGVSRQAIDLYRKQLSGSTLPGTRVTKPVSTGEPKSGLTFQHIPDQPPEPERTPSPTRTAQTSLSLDELVDLVIQAFSALKRVKELEMEISKIRKSYDALLQQVEQLQTHEQKRKEQEARWIHAQPPGIITGNQD